MEQKQNELCNHPDEHHDLVERAKHNFPKEETIEEVCAAFKAISEPSRLKILLALRQGELCVYHIVEAVGGTQSAVSHQLRILRANRMIKARRDGQNVLYSLADEHIVALLALAFTHQNCFI